MLGNKGGRRVRRWAYEGGGGGETGRGKEKSRGGLGLVGGEWGQGGVQGWWSRFIKR